MAIYKQYITFGIIWGVLNSLVKQAKHIEPLKTFGNYQEININSFDANDWTNTNLDYSIDSLTIDPKILFFNPDCIFSCCSESFNNFKNILESCKINFNEVFSARTKDVFSLIIKKERYSPKTYNITLQAKGKITYIDNPNFQKAYIQLLNDIENTDVGKLQKYFNCIIKSINNNMIMGGMGKCDNPFVEIKLLSNFGKDTVYYFQDIFPALRFSFSIQCTPFKNTY